MQFLVLFVGILVFVFFQFNSRPLHFNTGNVASLKGTIYESQYRELENTYIFLQEEQKEVSLEIIRARRSGDANSLTNALNRSTQLRERDLELRDSAKDIILAQNENAKTKDTDYVFITFVTEHLPIGLVGLLLAVIFSAAMSSTASELNALATTTVIDIYKRNIVRDKSDAHYLKASKVTTVLWGGIALLFAAFANLFDNLIQAVNIIGALFYGAILGIFLVAFFMKQVKGKAVFIGALIAEVIVLVLFYLNQISASFQIGSFIITVNIAYLWLNLIGCTLVMIFAYLIQILSRSE